ncbi:hypothetical protein INT44_008012 [Umbelopsis vinacea]|uniref:SPX domain-containing protein n=1 Tax=Umbelopsis vinacea TaxID=44442 RepID=A0A8H7U9N4_9FUNG|nr:hypothetical protein INT44_008012 [Umbelopsis vinacea]
MKFGEHLRKQRLPQWRFFYLDYDGLKSTLKKTTEKCEWADKDDELFIDRLVTELDKVHSFYALKLGETQRRIRSCQRRIQTLSMSQHPALSEYLSIQNEITDITCEVQELFWYTRLNYTGFIKIVKKHDRYAEQVPKLRGHFLTLLHHRSFYKAEAFSQLTTELAKLYDSARVSGHQPFNDFSTITPPNVITPIVRQHQPLVYKNTKYWVHPDNIMDVKTHILKYMPLISQNASSSPLTTGPPSTPPSHATDPAITHAMEERCSDELISSVYLDDPSFSSYMSRVQFLADQRTIRLRWYGNDTRNVHVERKSYNYINQEPVEGLPATQEQPDESSSKDRHTLKAKAVTEWLRGDWSVSEKLQKAQLKKQSSGLDWVMEDDDDLEIERLRSVAQEIQDIVVEDQLRPVVRTVFRRTVFQSPDENVRISMDTDFVMAQEFGWNDPEAPMTDPWRRDDLTAQTADEDQYLDIPNEPAHPDDYHRFRYAIVEVKLRTPQHPTTMCIGDNDEPDCIKTLVRARMMEPIPHFSKYVHAVSVLWDSKVPLLPFWLPQLQEGVYCPTGIRLHRAYHSTAESCDTGIDSQDRTPPLENSFQLQAPPSRPTNEALHIASPVLSISNETTPLLTPAENEAQAASRPTIAHSVRRLVQAVYPVILLILITAIALTIAEIEDRMLANVLGVLVAAMALAGFCLWMFVFKTSLTQTTRAI